mmetsp:Transcript_20172/g.20274  ORF Transcript_20172/g.20274 Transcript_20172/m.20274 type:complete len:260 (+) Transcript_20172:322-1101(+)|eukprot:CAMPEP_0182429728 /NCGR_PEP_ID=MMETSP1167-20130531/33001_1 /TAXON_ID=2988 /ORGANISM="Mallomonas Sp, Strain CCMP3275" /LENGTH=259 /DNA_ID=CAMNT_0024613857 /DNA_START=181 /DNA_END=960 /DNA_ORIENTATION=-
MNLSVSEVSLTLETGLLTTALVHRKDSEAAPKHIFIFGHGLGCDIIQPGDDKTESGTLLTIPRDFDISLVSYIARGHGNSSGWQDSAQINPNQFTWEYLSHDMISVANFYQCENVFIGGNSMGAGTAIFTAIHHPSRVRGMILMRPPTAWETRKKRRNDILKKADELQEMDPNQNFHHVLRGACDADLPPMNDVETYQRITCPVLILAIEGDPVHPVSTAETLSRLIPINEIHIASDRDSARKDWPDIISNFIRATLPE